MAAPHMSQRSSLPEASPRPPSPASPLRLASRLLVALGLLALLGGGFAGCLSRVSSSLGLRCETQNDCWDDLPCQNELCGGERRPRESRSSSESTSDASPPEEPTAPEPKPEPKPDASEPNTTPDTTPETSTDAPPTEATADGRACVGAVASDGTCTKDSDCCSGQTCKEVDLSSVGGPKLNLCSDCSADSDCPQGTICCTQAKPLLGYAFCAQRCSQ